MNDPFHHEFTHPDLDRDVDASFSDFEEADTQIDVRALVELANEPDNDVSVRVNESR